MEIYLVRHGETNENRQNIMQGQAINSQLNENGIKQATTLKNKINNIKFTACFTSPMIRTWSTAMILVGDRVEIKEDKRLIERYLGDLEGKDSKTYNASKYWDYNLNSNDQNVERVQEVFKRCKNFINELIKKYNDDDIIIVVSHSATIRCMHHLLKNSNLNNNLLDFKIENCYCNKYEIKKEG